jgi:mRNA interferase RelE/StbE
LAWAIEWDERAFKEFKRLGRKTQEIIKRYLKERIAPDDDPKRFGAPLSHDLAEFWKYRIGDYRVICRIEEEKLVIFIVRVRHRKHAYKDKSGLSRYQRI